MTMDPKKVSAKDSEKKKRMMSIELKHEIIKRMSESGKLHYKKKKKSMGENTNNWQSSEGFADTNLHMFEKGIACDVTFRVGPEQRPVQAHKFIMISRSHVFEKMLCGPMAEIGEIVIPDVDSETFVIFLRYLYTNSATLNPESALTLIYLAKKYNLERLEIRCLEFLASSITVDSVSVIFEQSKFFEEKELSERSRTFISHNAKEVFQSESFLSLSRESVQEIVRSDELDVKEEDIFVAVNKWAEYNCRKRGIKITGKAKREMFDSVTKDLRLPVMSQQFIVNTVCPSGLLKSEEQLALLKYVICPNQTSAEFSTKRRCRPHKCVYRFKTEDCGSWGACFGSDALSFKCNRNIKLHGFMLYGPKEKQRSSYDVEAKVINELGVEQTKITRKVEVEKDESKMFSVYFKEDVAIEANKMFTICYKMRGERTFCGDEDITHVVVDDFVFDFSDSELRTFDKEINFTSQIPALIFS